MAVVTNPSLYFTNSSPKKPFPEATIAGANHLFIGQAQFHGVKIWRLACLWQQSKIVPYTSREIIIRTLIN